MIAVMIMCGGLFGERETIYSMDPTACSVGWFTSLLVRLREREVLLTGSGEQYSCEGAGQPSQPSDHAANLQDSKDAFNKEMALTSLRAKESCSEKFILWIQNWL